MRQVVDGRVGPAAVGHVLLAAVPDASLASSAGVTRFRHGDAVAEHPRSAPGRKRFCRALACFERRPFAPSAPCRACRDLVTLGCDQGRCHRARAGVQTGPRRPGVVTMSDRVGNVTRERYEQIVAEARGRGVLDGRRSGAASGSQSCGDVPEGGRRGCEGASWTGPTQTGRQACEASGRYRVILVKNPSTRGFTHLSPQRAQRAQREDKLEKAQWHRSPEPAPQRGRTPPTG